MTSCEGFCTATLTTGATYPSLMSLPKLPWPKLPLLAWESSGIIKGGEDGSEFGLMWANKIVLSGFMSVSLSSCFRPPTCCWWTTTSARSWMESKKVRLSVKCSTLFWSLRQVPRKITHFYALTSSIEYSIAESKNDILEPACFCSGRKHGFQEMVLTQVDGMDGIDFQ